MALELQFPDITRDEEVEATPIETLGAPRTVRSRITVGRSDLVELRPQDAIDDEFLAQQLERRQDEIALVRLTFALNFRPANGEQFETALLVVELRAPEAGNDQQPVARVLEPERLTSGPFTLKRTLRVSAGTDGLPVKFEAGRSSERSVEMNPPYVVAAGVGESDPEWRYTRTEAMSLEGAHEMLMLVEVKRGTTAWASLHLSGTVRVGNRRIVEARYPAAERVSRIELQSVT